MKKILLRILSLTCLLISINFVGFTPSQVFAQCRIDAAATTVGLNPYPLKDGVKDQVYPTTSLTMVFAPKAKGTIDTTILTFKLKADFEIVYETIKVDSVYDIPPGMELLLTTCNETDCIYDLTKSDKGCVQISGTPTKTGGYFPTLIGVTQKGYFIMPDFGLPFSPPGLPKKGEKVDIMKTPALLSRFVDKYKIITLGSEISIYGDTSNQNFCTPDPAPKYMGLYPSRLKDGKMNVDYDKTTMTMVFQTDTLIQIDTTIAAFPIKADFNITFTEYTVDTALGLPKGMRLDLNTCNKIECNYRMPKQSRGCIEFSGKPEESGVFRPTLRAVADGHFIMPDLGPIGRLIPGLPPVGTKVILSEATGPIAFFLNGLRNRPIRSEIHILPEKYTDLCNVSVPIVKGVISPETIADGDTGKVYPTTNLTLDFPNFSNVDLGPNGRVNIRFTAFNIDSTADLPSGMEFANYCKAGNDCKYKLNEVDTALNRVCFTIGGTPRNGRQFEPRIITSAEGIVDAGFGQPFRLENLPQQLPQQLRRALDSLKIMRFSLSLKINPTTASVDETFENRLKAVLYPNPSANSAQISFDLNQNEKVGYQVMDLTGKVIATQIPQEFSAGRQNIQLNSELLNTGIYILELKVGEKTRSFKWCIMK